jgi:hypothetical protein
VNHRTFERKWRFAVPPRSMSLRVASPPASARSPPAGRLAPDSAVAVRAAVRAFASAQGEWSPRVRRARSFSRVAARSASESVADVCAFRARVCGHLDLSSGSKQRHTYKREGCGASCRFGEESATCVVPVARSGGKKLLHTVCASVPLTRVSWSSAFVGCVRVVF